MKSVKHIPYELVDIIISFIDYKKYHQKNYINVIKDIKEISTIFVIDNNHLPPNIIYACWGNGWKKYHEYIEF